MAQAAQNYNRWESIVRTRVLEWPSQADHLAKEADRLSALVAKEKAELQALEKRGARSLLNPYGATVYTQVHPERFSNQ